MRLLVSIIFFLISGSAAFGQVYEEMKVIYRDVRVHVLDKDGNPVTGLTKEDFSVEESKKNQEVDYFEEVNLDLPVTSRAESPSAPIQQTSPAPAVQPAGRFIVLFLDSSNMDQKNFEEARKSMLDLVDNKLKQGDRVKLVHMDAIFEHKTGFTNDLALVASKIGELSYKGRLRRELTSIQRSINSTIEQWDESPPDMQPSFELNINAMIKEKARTKADSYRTNILNMMSIGYMMENIKGSKSVFLFSGGGYVEPATASGGTSHEAEELGRIMNRADCTIYSLMFASPNNIGGEPANLNLRSVPPGWANQLKSSSVFPPGSEPLEIAANTIFEDNSQYETGPSMAAEETGGFYLKSYNGNNSPQQLERMVTVANHYYRLGWATEKVTEKTILNIELKAKERGWKLVYGEEFEPETDYLALKDDRRQMAFEAMLLFGQTWRNDLDAVWSYHTFSRKDGGYRTVVMGRLPMAARPRKGFEFGFVAMDKDNSPLDITTTTLKNLPEIGENLQYYDVLLTDHIPAIIRTSIRNLDNGDLGFHQFEVEELETDDHLLRLGEVLMSARTKEKRLPLNHLRVINSESPSEFDQKRREEDPFRLDGNIFQADMAPYHFKAEPLWFMFHVENPPEAAYQVQFLVKGKEGFLQVQGKVVTKWQEEGHNLHIQGAINASELPPGDYLLAVRVVFDGQAPVMGNVPFSIVENPSVR